MLYGMEEFEDEFGLIKQPKLNIKKVAIVVSIVLVFIIIIIAGFVLPKKDKDNTEMFAVEEVDNMETEREIEASENTEKEKNEKEKTENKVSKKNIVNNKNESEYDGIHAQIPLHNMENLENRFVPVANENAQAIIKDIYYSDEKQVYLTFDDGPSKDITPQILDVLKENDVKATFFVLGARVELYPETLKREYDEGHYIANHGYSHNYSSIYQSRDTVFQEYVDCENSIKNALDNQDYNSYLFRFPGGSSGGKYESVKAEARELFKEYNVAYTNWNCLTGDADQSLAGKTKEKCVENMIETKGNQNSIILLMHDANDKQQTVEALPEIIQYFKDEGYTFKNFYEVFQ